MEEWFMLEVTEAAKEELEERLKTKETKKIIRLKMRQSCFMKVKVGFEETIQPNDTEMVIDGLHFIIGHEHLHYFRDKTLDFVPDQTGFKEFDVR
jgi:Fe-S cluster assembly iron-binding protein IscA